MKSELYTGTNIIKKTTNFHASLGLLFQNNNTTEHVLKYESLELLN